jgi:hypothetical protein
LIVSAIGSATIYGRIVSDLNGGFGQGISVIISRCYGLNDYVGIQKFLWMYYEAYSYGSFITFLYLLAMYYVFGFMYADDPRLLYYIRAALVLQFPGWYFVGCKNSIKNFYIASKCNLSSLWVEVASVGWYVLAFWIGGVYFHFDSFTTIFAALFSAVAS